MKRVFLFLGLVLIKCEMLVAFKEIFVLRFGKILLFLLIFVKMYK